MKIKKLNENAIVPTRASEHSAGYDLYACTSESIVIIPHQTAMIGTGIALEIPEGYFGGIAARSGLACKYGVAPANKLGIIDSDYRGEIKVALHNHSDIPYTINPMDRIAQLIIIPYASLELEEVQELSDTERADGGFGHSGK